MPNIVEVNTTDFRKYHTGSDSKIWSCSSSSQETAGSCVVEWLYRNQIRICPKRSSREATDAHFQPQSFCTCSLCLERSSLKYLGSFCACIFQVFAQISPDQGRLPLTILSKWCLLSAYHFLTFYPTLFFLQNTNYHLTLYYSFFIFYLFPRISAL